MTNSDMAQRRMFSPLIVESEEFVTMPASSQSLYFHLGMNADDDGFIQPRGIMRSIGATEDDLKILLVKRFLLTFESGVVVVKHWLIHNLIQKDRYHPTRFIEEKKGLFIKENKSYTDNPQSVNKMLPEVRLGKVRLLGGEESPQEKITILPEEKDTGEVSISRTDTKRVKDKEAVFYLFSATKQPWWSHSQERLAALRLFDLKGVEQVEKALALVHENRDDKFCPKVNRPFQLEEKWDDLFSYKEKNNL